MLRFFLRATQALVVLVASSASFPAQAPEKAQPGDEDQQVFKSSPVKVTPAASIPFRKAYNLPFPTLNTVAYRHGPANRRSHCPGPRRRGTRPRREGQRQDGQPDLQAAHG